MQTQNIRRAKNEHAENGLRFVLKTINRILDTCITITALRCGTCVLAHHIFQITHHTTTLYHGDLFNILQIDFQAIPAPLYL